MNTATLNLEQMKRLRQEIDAHGSARVRVGIMANHADRFDADWNKEKLNNPTIGLIHEFGSKGGSVPSGETGPGAQETVTTRAAVPARSFLRMPLMTRLPDQLEKIGKDVWRSLVTNQGLLVALKQLGVMGENIVQRAFETGGFGQWAPLSRYTIMKKGSSAILIDTGYLRKSITSAVVPGRGKP